MLIVDGYNVLHAAPTDGTPTPSSPASLAAWIDRSRLAAGGAVIVLDGVPRTLPAPYAAPLDGQSCANVRIMFAGPHATADDEIERIISLSSSPRDLLVISSDRRLRRAGTRAGAGVMGSIDFLRALGRELRRKVPSRPAFAKDIPLDRGSVAYWMRRFGEGEPAWPARPEPTTPKRPAPIESLESPALRGPAPESRPPPDLRDDPIIQEALREWSGRLRVEDLDMTRWLRERGK